MTESVIKLPHYDRIVDIVNKHKEMERKKKQKIKFEIPSTAVLNKLFSSAFGGVDSLSETKQVDPIGQLEHVLSSSIPILFPSDKETMIRGMKNDNTSYHQAVRNFLSLSKDNGEHLITPFKVSMIEDPTSIVIVERVFDPDVYRVTSCKNIGPKSSNIPAMLFCADVCIGGLMNNGQMNFPYIKPQFAYTPHGINQHIFGNINSLMKFMDIIARDTNEFILENMHVLSGENTLIKKIDRDSVGEFEKLKNGKYFKKSSQISTYHVADKEKVENTFKTKKGIKFHHVFPFTRILRHPKYLANMEQHGGKAFVKGYTRGEGCIKAPNGALYVLMVQEDFNKFVLHPDYAKNYPPKKAV